MVSLFYCDASNPMSGYALPNLINGIVAGLVNIGLNYFLFLNMAHLVSATSTTLGVWAMCLVEARYLLRCFPFHFFMLTGTVLTSVL